MLLQQLTLAAAATIMRQGFLRLACRPQQPPKLHQEFIRFNRVRYTLRSLGLGKLSQVGTRHLAKVLVGLYTPGPSLTRSLWPAAMRTGVDGWLASLMSWACQVCTCDNVV